MKTTRLAHPVHPKIGVSGVQTILAAILGIAITLTLSCDSATHPSALVGRWVGVSGEDDVMELLGDGTGIVTGGSRGLSITWKTESGRIYFTASGMAEAKGYKLYGSLLTFTDDEGNVSEYAKCKKDCKEVAEEYAKAEAEKITSALKAKFAGVKTKFAGVKKGSFSDSRDGKSYKTVKLNSQTWMAENLNYNAEGSKCYDNSESNCQKYGRLYNWKTATKACPKGWHLPTKAEWDILTAAVGGEETEGIYLKATSGWNENGNGADVIGFSALPGGNYYHGGFLDAGSIGSWWSASEGYDNRAYIRRMNCYNGNADWDDGPPKSLGFSVRCLQD